MMMKHRSWLILFATFLATAVVVPTVMSAEPRKTAHGKSMSAKQNKEAIRHSKKQNDNDSRSDARADMADPSGDYKSYPNWARAALGPSSMIELLLMPRALE